MRRDDALERASRTHAQSAGLRGKKVLITRPAADATAFAARLREAGAEPLSAPAIAIVPADDAEPAAAALRDLGRYRWLVLTSRHGVDAFFAGARRIGGVASTLRALKIAAIGTRTAERLRVHGARADFVPAQFTGEAIAAGLIERTQRGERLLLYRAQEARETLAALLRAAGRDVDDVAAYKTMALANPALPGLAAEADIWTFTSGSAVRAFARNVPGAAALAQSKTVACIGPLTAQAAHALGFAVAVVAAESTVDGLVEALAAASAVSPKPA